MIPYFSYLYDKYKNNTKKNIAESQDVIHNYLGTWYDMHLRVDELPYVGSNNTSEVESR